MRPLCIFLCTLCTKFSKTNTQKERDSLRLPAFHRKIEPRVQLHCADVDVDVDRQRDGLRRGVVGSERPLDRSFVVVELKFA